MREAPVSAIKVMRILKIVPGSGGGFLCENCLRDQALIAELRWAGHDLCLVPLYLPLAGTPEGERVAVPVFYGAVRVYLEHRFAFLRRMPARFRGYLDSKRLLRAVARRPGTRSGPVLADLTLSVLRGENGGQAAELDRLCEWLKGQPEPDVIHLSNLLLIGLARRLRALFNAPVLCSIQDEDGWIDSAPGLLATRSWAEIRARSPDIAGFIASSHYYAAKMVRRLGLPPRSVRVVHPGLDPGAIAVVPRDALRPIWGVLVDEAGRGHIDRVVDALIAARNRYPECAALRLRVAGVRPPHASQAASEPWRARLEQAGCAATVEWLPEFSRQGDRLRFLESATVLTVLHGQMPAFDLSLLEAMSSGAALVLPRDGANPEILAMAEGGLLYDQDSPEALAATLAQALREAPRLVQAGRRGVEHGFSVGRMARETLDVYRAVLQSERPLQPRPRPAPAETRPRSIP